MTTFLAAAGELGGLSGLSFLVVYGVILTVTTIVAVALTKLMGGRRIRSREHTPELHPYEAAMLFGWRHHAVLSSLTYRGGASGGCGSG